MKSSTASTKRDASAAIGFGDPETSHGFDVTNSKYKDLFSTGGPCMGKCQVLVHDVKM